MGEFPNVFFQMLCIDYDSVLLGIMACSVDKFRCADVIFKEVRGQIRVIVFENRIVWKTPQTMLIR